MTTSLSEPRSPLEVEGAGVVGAARRDADRVLAGERTTDASPRVGVDRDRPRAGRQAGDVEVAAAVGEVGADDALAVRGRQPDHHLLVGLAAGPLDVAPDDRTLVDRA